MPKKLAIAALKAALQDSPEAAREFFKKKFTPGFYHGSPSNDIIAFDPSKTIKDVDMATQGVTFVSPKPRFAESYLADPAKEKIAEGATMYPVSVNMGKHFDPATQEGSATIKQFLLNKYKKEADNYGFDEAINQKHEHYMDRLTDPINNWRLLESPELLNHLKATGHDTFSVTEAGVKNVGVFEPHNIRGKFAKYDPAEEFNPDFMKAKGGSIDLPEGGDLLHQQTPSNLPDVNLSVHGMPSINGMPGVGYMQTPQGAIARMQFEKELADKARMRAAVSGSAMAIPGLHGVKTMPGQIEAGYNAPVGPGRADIGAFRTINPIPGKGHIQGVNARYTIPFKKGGKVS